jgi:hypothetical protein
VTNNVVTIEVNSSSTLSRRPVPPPPVENIPRTTPPPTHPPPPAPVDEVAISNTPAGVVAAGSISIISVNSSTGDNQTTRPTEETCSTQQSP